jgi:hypothetical protein
MKLELFNETGVFFNEFTIACLVWAVLAVARQVFIVKAKVAFQSGAFEPDNLNLIIRAAIAILMLLTE